MKDSVRKMETIIDSLVSWLNDYPDQILLNHQKVRISNILERLKESQVFSKAELENLFNQKVSAGKNKNYKSNRLSSGSEKSQDSRIFFKCEACNAKVLLKNKENHRKKCSRWKKLHYKGPVEVKYFKYSKGTSPVSDLPGRSYESKRNELKDQMQAERKADATRDHFLIRENGRFGSSPSYDDYGDESMP